MKQFFRMIESWNESGDKKNNEDFVVIPRHRVESIRDTLAAWNTPEQAAWIASALCAHLNMILNLTYRKEHNE